MTSPVSQLLFISRHSAWTAAAGACMETLLTAGVFEQHPVLVLLDEAVTQLVSGQNGEALGLKTLANQLPALELYGIHAVYVDAEALRTRGLAEAELLIPVQYLRPGQLADLIATARNTLVF